MSPARDDPSALPPLTGLRGLGTLLAIGWGSPPVAGIVEAREAMTLPERARARRLARRGEAPRDARSARYVEALGRNAERRQHGRAKRLGKVRSLGWLFAGWVAWLSGFIDGRWDVAGVLLGLGATLELLAHVRTRRRRRVIAAGHASARAVGRHPGGAESATVSRVVERQADVIAMGVAGVAYMLLSIPLEDGPPLPLALVLGAAVVPSYRLLFGQSRVRTEALRKRRGADAGVVAWRRLPDAGSAAR